MPRYRVFVTGGVDAEHHCNCELCHAPRYIEKRGAFDDVVEAEDAGNAEALALAALWKKLEETGYCDDVTTERATVHYVDPVSDLELVNYPRLPDLVGV